MRGNRNSVQMGYASAPNYGDSDGGQYERDDENMLEAHFAEDGDVKEQDVYIKNRHLKDEHIKKLHK